MGAAYHYGHDATAADGPKSYRPEHLLTIRSVVAADGDCAVFDLAFTNQTPFRAMVPFNQMPTIFSEVRQASALMIQRQRFQLDRGAGKLLELADTALRPVHVDVFVDPRNGDRIFVHQFEDHSPIAFRVSPVELAHNLRMVTLSLNRAGN